MSLDSEWIKVSSLFKNTFLHKDIQSFWESVFEGIGNTEFGAFFCKKISSASCNTIFRARWFEDSLDIEKIFENPGEMLGPPPTSKAGSGRMNLNHQNVFYGAEEQETAISEIRPPVGSYVAVGKFKVLEDIILFDIVAFNEIHKQNKLKITASQADFLMNLSNRISFPVTPNNTNEYFMTQSLIFFIKNKFKNINGIRYDSPQTGYLGKNIMLFESNFSIKKVQYQRCRVTPTSWGHAPCDLSIRYQLTQTTQPSTDPATLQLSPEDIDIYRINSINYECKKSHYKKIILE